MCQSSNEPDTGSCRSGDSAATGSACYPAAESLRIRSTKQWIDNSFVTTKLTPTANQPSADTSDTGHFLKTTSKAEYFAVRNCLTKRPFVEVKSNNSVASKGVSSVISKRRKQETEANVRFLNESDSLYDSFNNSNSILESIDFDQLDACINNGQETGHSEESASHVPSDVPVPSDVLHYANRCFAGQQSKCGIANNCIPGERTDVMDSRDESKASPTENSKPSGIGCRNSGFNILQAIDIADGASPACPPSANIDPSAVSSKNSVADSNRRRVSVFADRLRKTFAANAKVDTPVRKRQTASVLNDCNNEESDGNLEEKTGVHCNPENGFYGLPLRVRELLIEHRSISELYDWQKKCLSLTAVCNGSNLIYSLPTSGGKTLVAEMLILRQILCRKKDAILILPFVAIVQEKVRAFTPFAIELEFCIEEYAASKGAIPPRQHRSRRSLYIATIEKANSLINSLIEKKRIDCIGLVVVDELHMLGEGGSRGATLETALTKVIYSNPGTQIVGMSATLSNIKDLEKFLNAEVYTDNFRPVQLKEFVKFGDTIFEVDCANPDDCLKFSRVTAFRYDKEMNVSDPDQLAGLVLEVVPQNSCLVFCPTKKNCENVAQLLCKMIRMFPKKLREFESKSKERRLLYESLKLEGGGVVCPILRATVPFGVAYHHSGLTSDERKLIEEAYLDGTLCVLACTSTLAAGVNLPARRVILRSPYVGRSFISRSQYKQMTGRAGRAGIDTIGESVLIVTSAADKQKLPDLVGGSYDRCISSLLYEGNKGIRSLLLSTVGLQITNSVGDVVAFMSRTLCHVQSHLLDISVTEVTKNALQKLIDTQLLRQRVATGESQKESDSQEHERDTILEVTDLGRAVFKGSIDVDYSKKLYADLSSTQQSIVLDNYLHLLFLVTPYDMVDINQAPNWMTYLRELGTLSASELKVASLIGASENHIARKASGHRFRQHVDEFAVRRFYLTLMLYGLWKQKTIWDVSSRFGVSRGFIQQLLTGAASFGTCINYFCQELDEFWGYQDLMTNFVKKLSFCCMLELAPLMEIPGVKTGRARQLHRAGYRSLQHIAYADPDDLVRQIEHLPRRLARQIVSSAQMVLTEKAEAMLAEVDDMISVPPPPGEIPPLLRPVHRKNLEEFYC